MAAALVVLAGLFSAADAAIGGFSRARAEELVAEGASGSKRLLTILDDPARYLNTALLLRLLCETAAIVLVALWVHDLYDGDFWPAYAHRRGRDAARVLRGRSGSPRAPSVASTTNASRPCRPARCPS